MPETEVGTYYEVFMGDGSYERYATLAAAIASMPPETQVEYRENGGWRWTAPAQAFWGWKEYDEFEKDLELLHA